MLVKALFVVVMTSWNGNATTGSESVTITESITECRAAMISFMQSKGQVKSVSRGENNIDFTVVSDKMFIPGTDYKVSCTELKSE